MLLNRCLAIATLAFVSLASLSNHSLAQTRGFAIFGEGVATTGLPLPGQEARAHNSEGFATFLGKYQGLGSLKTDTAVQLRDGRYKGEFGSAAPFVFTGADGSKLVCHYGRTDFGARKAGTFELIPFGPRKNNRFIAIFVAEFVPVTNECTGKFAGVTGSWMMYATTRPFVLGSTDPIKYNWAGSGTLKFVQAR